MALDGLRFRGGCLRARDRFYPMFRDRMQTRRFRQRMAAARLPGLRPDVRHRPWATAAAGPPRFARLDSGAARVLQRLSRTLTALPAWCVPRAHYSRAARRQAVARLAAGDGFEQAAPDCLDPDRVADPSTIRRWAWRRIHSLYVCAASRCAAFFLFCAPTLLAWDFFAAARMLIVEASPP